MVEHANALVDADIGALLIDPFGGRGVTETRTAQDQFSFAASTFDIFAALRTLRKNPAVHEGRVGAMGYSRGGNAVLQAAIQPLASAALEGGPPLRAVLAGWPWCGYQFDAPETSPTSVRFVVADSDNYVSVPQSQAYASAMLCRNPNVSLRLVRDAQHGFGYGNPIMERPEGLKALSAPIFYFNERGTLLDPWTSQPCPGIDDKAILKMMTPFTSRGAKVGSKDGQKDDFIADFVNFFSAALH